MTWTSHGRRRLPLGFAIVLLVATVATVAAAPPHSTASAQVGTPTLQVTDVVTGPFNRIWDVAFSGDGHMFFTERQGRLWVRTPAGGLRLLSADLSDLWASGETGFMSVEADPGFLSNRRLYTCQGTTDFGNTVQVVTWVVDAAYTTAVRVNDPLVGGIDGQFGRHGGCQLRVDHEGFLRVSTGDAALGTNPQNLASLAGKTLRVDRFTGAAAPGNALASIPGADPRIFTYGHRNVQGLALRPGTLEVWSVEHGPGRQDEVNRLINGANYGWDPVPGYNESVEMTDLVKFPNAVPAVWNSGNFTIATSGGAFLEGSQWGAWQGALAVSNLASQHLRILPVNSAGQVGAPIQLFNNEFGRLRAAELGPDGVLYLTTDNGDSQDRVLAVRATGVDYAGVGVTRSAAGRIDLATRRADDSVVTRQFTGSWSPFAGTGGLASADPDFASWGPGRLDLFARGVDGALWHRAQGGAWQSLGGFITSAPTAVSWAPNRIDVFARGLDGGLWANAWTGSAWFGWYSLGGTLTSEPDVASWASGRLDVVAEGADGALWHRAWTGSGWSPWQTLGGGMVGGPGATSWGPNRLDVFVRGLDGQLWSRAWTGTQWWPWYPLGGSLTSAPDAMSLGTNQLEVFVRSNNAAIWRKTWANNQWSGWTALPP